MTVMVMAQIYGALTLLFFISRLKYGYTLAFVTFMNKYLLGPDPSYKLFGKNQPHEQKYQYHYIR